MSASSSTAARPVLVQPLSAQAELLILVRIGMAIVATVGLYVAFAIGSGLSPGQRNLMPFQQLIADRPPDDQRMFRELQEGLLEAEGMRSAAEAWPAPTVLADAGIPPFAADPTRRRAYDWRLQQNRTLVNYLGRPKDEDSPAWLIVVVEPEPGAPPDQPFEDQEHHRLLNGAMLHVATWVHPNGRAVADRLVRMPQTEGWIQLYAVSASAPPASSPPP